MLGYITHLKVTAPNVGFQLINHTTMRALNTLTSGEIVHARIIGHPNYDKINFDGTNRSPISPGILTQNIRVNPGAKAFFESLRLSHLSFQSTAQFTELDGSLHYANIIMTALKDTTTFRISTREYMTMALTFDILTLWRNHI